MDVLQTLEKNFSAQLHASGDLAFPQSAVTAIKVSTVTECKLLSLKVENKSKKTAAINCHHHANTSQITVHVPALKVRRSSPIHFVNVSLVPDHIKINKAMIDHDLQPSMNDLKESIVG